MEKEEMEVIRDYELTEEDRIEQEIDYQETRQELSDFIEIVHIN